MHILNTGTVIDSTASRVKCVCVDNIEGRSFPTQMQAWKTHMIYILTRHFWPRSLADLRFSRLALSPPKRSASKNLIITSVFTLFCVAGTGMFQLPLSRERPLLGSLCGSCTALV